MSFETLLGFGLLLVLLIIIVPVLAVVFWIVMLVDCLKRKFREKNDKLVWTIVIVFLSFIGALIYYFIVKRHD